MPTEVITMSDTDSVFDNWRKLRREISEQKMPNAMTDLTIAIENEAVMRAPVATSTLVNSAYHEIQKMPNGWQGTVGFTANYAFYVHESKGTLINAGVPRHPATLGYVWDGVGGDQAEPKFLENAADYIVESGIAQKILEDNLG